MNINLNALFNLLFGAFFVKEPEVEAMTLFHELIDEIIIIEGGYVNDPNDSGGATRWGITLAVARAYGYKGRMDRLPKSMAKQIYKERYWNALKLDEIEKISPGIVKELLDTGINQGNGRAGEYLQTSLNAFNNRGKHYSDLKVDGDIGKATLTALRAFVAKRGSEGESVLYKSMNCLQGAFYLTIAQKWQKNETFVYGWIKNRI